MEWLASVGAGDGEGQVDNPGPRRQRSEHKTEVYLLKPGSKGFSPQYGPYGLKSRLPPARSGKATSNKAPATGSYTCAGDVAPVAIGQNSNGMLEMVRAIAAAQERRRIARDLHDHAGQYFVGIMLRLAALELYTSEPTTHAALRDLRTVLEQFSDEVRGICAGERCGVPRGSGLVAALEDLVLQWEREVGIAVRFDREMTDGSDLDDTTAEAVFRIVQEALTNVAKHAPQASLVNVRLQLKPQMLGLEIEDDGLTRCEPPSSSLRSVGQHCGINGMRDRVAELGGNFSVRHLAGKGTRIVATIPLINSSYQRTGTRQ
ncbi:MAG: sensor histidine kinase [Mesorhizobium sp.]|nr:MAG: sensor histidine kinase [Mesorhizobium sp.]TIS92955.1 MAG: sensor histidine kinase [Mesorhizobium sp.]TJW14860.1 MAG: sensor histidine kinase [Mesorhizobium sp.]